MSISPTTSPTAPAQPSSTSKVPGLELSKDASSSGKGSSEETREGRTPENKADISVENYTEHIMIESESENDEYTEPSSKTEIVWNVILNANEEDVGVDYLLDKSIPWSTKRMTMVFALPNIIGMERKEKSLDLQPLEKVQIAKDIILHLRKEGIISKKSSAPAIWFQGSLVYVHCKNYRMAERLLERPPLHRSYPMAVVSKPFRSHKPDAYLCQWSCPGKDAQLKARFTEYVESLKDRLDTKHVLALSQYYRFYNGYGDDKVFTGTFVFFAGALKPGSLPEFEGILPQKIEY